MNAKFSLLSNLANYSALLPPPLYRKLWFETRSAYLLRKHSAQILPNPKTEEEERANEYNKQMMIHYLADIELEAKRMLRECKCKGRPDRHVGCHATCEDYIEWKKEYDRIRKNVQERERIEKMVEDDYHRVRSRRRRKTR